jgi:hypothetical protein
MDTTARARSIFQQYQSKKQFLETGLSSYVSDQDKLLQNLSDDCQELAEVVIQAHDLIASQGSAKNQFMDQYHSLIVTKLLPMIQQPCLSPDALDELRVLCSQVELDPVLNAADPVWDFFLKTRNALSLNPNMSPTSLAKCSRFILACMRWSPDSACLTREAKLGLQLATTDLSGLSNCIFL